MREYCVSVVLFLFQVVNRQRRRSWIEKWPEVSNIVTLVINNASRQLKLYCIDYSICGTLHSVDQYLNIKLTDISVTDPDKYPHMVCYFDLCSYPGWFRIRWNFMIELLTESHCFFIDGKLSAISSLGNP